MAQAVEATHGLLRGSGDKLSSILSEILRRLRCEENAVNDALHRLERLEGAVGCEIEGAEMSLAARIERLEHYVANANERSESAVPSHLLQKQAEVTTANGTDRGSDEQAEMVDKRISAMPGDINGQNYGSGEGKEEEGRSNSPTATKASVAQDSGRSHAEGGKAFEWHWQGKASEHSQKGRENKRTMSKRAPPIMAKSREEEGEDLTTIMMKGTHAPWDERSGNSADKARLAHLERSMEKLMDKMEQLSEDVGRVERSDQSLSGSVEWLRSRLDSHDRRIGVQERKSNSHDEGHRLESLESLIDSLSGEINAIKAMHHNALHAGNREHEMGRSGASRSPSPSSSLPPTSESTFHRNGSSALGCMMILLKLSRRAFAGRDAGWWYYGQDVPRSPSKARLLGIATPDNQRAGSPNLSRRP